MGFFKETAAAARDALKSYKDFSGADLNDVFGPLHEPYERQLENARAARNAKTRLQRAEERMRAHLRQNILHYMRAIWRAEDPDQRLLRYRQIIVTTGISFIADTPGGRANWITGVRGRFIPNVQKPHRRRLSDIIDLTGPIGFYANCAVYYLRSDPDLVNRNEALGAARSAYMEFLVRATDRNSAARSSHVFHATAISARFRRVSYRVDKAQNDGWTATIRSTGEAVTVTKARGGAALRLDGIYVQLGADPGNITVSFDLYVEATDRAVDPEERAGPNSFPLPLAADEAAFWTPELLLDMTEIVAPLGDLIRTGAPIDWAALTADEKHAVRQAYYSYLVRRRHSRSVVLEGANLVLDLDIGRTAALEDFKRLHRAVDVLKEVETVAQRQVENSRRERRLQLDDLEDPDIEQMNLTRIQLDAARDGGDE